MKANQTHSGYPRQSFPRYRTRWTWELETIGAVLALVWLAGVVQFLHHMS
ncbi:hypothetical protein SAMN05518801_11311 [Novosphingobium sp. CF614]|nr:hypothetical protein [Novosphingobium sp. CF614]SFG26837.1 hypothetical protein SAMN05518801_11311 [Novosphingobium sp. CF614]